MADPEYFPLFCTTQVPTEIISDFLEKSESAKTGGNIWTLIKTRDQTTFSKPTTAPISAFTTSFANATLDDLGTFCRTHFPSDSTNTPLIAWNEFAIMDERSVKDSTVLLVKWELWTQHIDPDATANLDDESNLEQKEGWQTLRVPFTGAAGVMDGIGYLSVREFNMTDEGFDENGVYHG